MTVSRHAARCKCRHGHIGYGSFSAELSCLRHVRFPPNRDRVADRAGRQHRAGGEGASSTALLHKTSAIDAGIVQFSEAARVRFTQ
jgi:hypothetical protein